MQWTYDITCNIDKCILFVEMNWNFIQQNEFSSKRKDNSETFLLSAINFIHFTKSSRLVDQKMIVQWLVIGHWLALQVRTKNLLETLNNPDNTKKKIIQGFSRDFWLCFQIFDTVQSKWRQFAHSVKFRVGNRWV